MTQKLNPTEIPASGWTAFELKGEVVMLHVSQNGPVIMFTKQGEQLFVPWIEVIEFASTLIGKATSRVIEEPTKPV